MACRTRAGIEIASQHTWKLARCPCQSQPPTPPQTPPSASTIRSGGNACYVASPMTAEESWRPGSRREETGLDLNGQGSGCGETDSSRELSLIRMLGGVLTSLFTLSPTTRLDRGGSPSSSARRRPRRPSPRGRPQVSHQAEQRPPWRAKPTDRPHARQPDPGPVRRPQQHPHPAPDQGRPLGPCGRPFRFRYEMAISRCAQ